MKLYYNPLSTNARLAVATINHLGTKVELQALDFQKGEHKAPEYLKLNPNGKVPTLVDGDLSLWECFAIATYLAEKAPPSSFYPTDARGRAEMNRWTSWKLAHFGPAVGGIVLENFLKPMLWKQASDQTKIDQSTEQLHVFAPVLNAHLEAHQWLVNDTLTLADFVMGCPLTYAVPGKVPLDRYPHIRAWYDRLSTIEGWKNSMPKL
jgi:glutathione S-transferase